MCTNMVFGKKARQKKSTIMLQLNIRSGCKQQINIECLNLGNKFFWLSPVSQSTQLNVSAYNLEKNMFASTGTHTLGF